MSRVVAVAVRCAVVLGVPVLAWPAIGWAYGVLVAGVVVGVWSLLDALVHPMAEVMRRWVEVAAIAAVVTGVVAVARDGLESGILSVVPVVLACVVLPAGLGSAAGGSLYDSRRGAS